MQNFPQVQFWLSTSTVLTDPKLSTSTQSVKKFDFHEKVAPCPYWTRFELISVVNYSTVTVLQYLYYPIEGSWTSYDLNRIMCEIIKILRNRRVGSKWNYFSVFFIRLRPTVFLLRENLIFNIHETVDQSLTLFPIVHRIQFVMKIRDFGFYQKARNVRKSCVN